MTPIWVDNICDGFCENQSYESKYNFEIQLKIDSSELFGRSQFYYIKTITNVIFVTTMV